MIKHRWQLLTVGILINGGLILYAGTRWAEISHFAGEFNLRAPQVAEAEALKELERAAAQAAKTRDLNSFEKSRVEQSVHFLQGGLRPNPSAALYFYPETLPTYSLEREFAQNSLKPGIDSLRSAFMSRSPASTQHAYRVLESRVVNYEGGASSQVQDLSTEAQTFLRVYGHFRLTH